MTRDERRDMFAAAALQGLLARDQGRDEEITADAALAYADEMLRQLDAEREPPDAGLREVIATLREAYAGAVNDVVALRAKLDTIADVVVGWSHSPQGAINDIREHLGDHYDQAVQRREGGA